MGWDAPLTLERSTAPVSWEPLDPYHPDRDWFRLRHPWPTAWLLLLWLPGLLAEMPKSALAAVVIAAAIGLIVLPAWRRLCAPWSWAAASTG